MESRMPIYEYACTNGCPIWEVLQKITEPPVVKCPKCNKKTAQKMISGGGAFILKGKGFYKPSHSDVGE